LAEMIIFAFTGWQSTKVFYTHKEDLILCWWRKKKNVDDI